MRQIPPEYTIDAWHVFFDALPSRMPEALHKAFAALESPENPWTTGRGWLTDFDLGYQRWADGAAPSVEVATLVDAVAMLVQASPDLGHMWPHLTDAIAESGHRKSRQVLDALDAGRQQFDEWQASQ